MQPHQQRVVEEETDLAEKVTKLTSFIGGTIFDGLPLAEQGRLGRQLNLMRGYLDILRERIAAFGVPQ